MAILPDFMMRERIESGSLVIEPYDGSMVQPASIDVRLGEGFLKFYRGQVINAKSRGVSMHEHSCKSKITLAPGEMCLGTTLERVVVPDDCLMRLEGKSSLARLGILVHVTAGFIDPGFDGQITLEIVNLSPCYVELESGIAIGQLSLEQMAAPAERPYGSEGLGSHYQAQRGVTASRA